MAEWCACECPYSVQEHFMKIFFSTGLRQLSIHQGDHDVKGQYYNKRIIRWYGGVVLYFNNKNSHVLIIFFLRPKFNLRCVTYVIKTAHVNITENLLEKVPRNEKSALPLIHVNC